MVSAREIPVTTPCFNLKGQAGKFVVIRLNVYSKMAAPAVLQPALDAWVLPDGEPVETRLRVAPSYAYLSQGQEARLTLTLTVPPGLQPGDRLRGGLHFPGIGEESLPLELEITPSTDDIISLEHNISVILPLAGYEPDDDPQSAGTKAIYTLLSGLAGMEVIPAKWVVAELLLKVCETGADYIKTEEGSQQLERISRLRFFKNGVLAFRGAHIVNWIMVGVTVSSGLYSALGDKTSHGRMLYTWEKWLYDLIDIDIENFSDEGLETNLPPPDVETTLTSLGMETERWFGCLLLGLVKLSPRIRSIVEQLADSAPDVETTEDIDDIVSNDVLSEKGSLQR